MAKPLFVLGKARSGTTWLANQLCEHSAIAGIQHERHHGIHESAFFSRVEGRYGDLTDRSSFIEFVEVMSASDYFRLTGATKDFLQSLWPATYADVFRIVMDGYAASRNATYWLEKTPGHTLVVDRLARLYPDAAFIGVVRDVGEVVRSQLAMYEMYEPAGGHQSGGSFRNASKDSTWRWKHVIGIAMRWAYYNKLLFNFASRSDRMLIVRYADLRTDLASTLRTICDFLGLRFEEGMCAQRYSPNTSFQRGEQRGTELSQSEKRMARIASRLVGILPVGLTRLGVDYRSRNRRPPLPSWFFNLLPVELGVPATESRRSDSSTGSMAIAEKSIVSEGL